MIRVLVAEDSQSIRVLLVSLLEADPEIEVVGQVGDGASAVESAKRLRPDVITMDIHMPGLDGLEATARIMNEAPTPIVVVSSSVSARDVASSFGAMKAGALLALPTPGSGSEPEADRDRLSFVATVKAMAKVKVVRRWSGAYKAASPLASPPPVPPVDRRQQRATLVAIAASTGGPTALQRVLADLPATFPAPVVVVQHISPGFLAGFAGWLNTECSIRVKVAENGEALEAGTVYVAPDGGHLGVTSNRRVRISSEPPVSGFRPSASALFESAADAYGEFLVAVILTGMGSDGVSGLRRVHGIGGYVIAQDEATSLIYGMPGEAVRGGVVNLSLPIDLIGAHLIKLTSVSRTA